MWLFVGLQHLFDLCFNLYTSYHLLLMFFYLLLFLLLLLLVCWPQLLLLHFLCALLLEFLLLNFFFLLSVKLFILLLQLKPLFLRLLLFWQNSRRPRFSSALWRRLCPGLHQSLCICVWHWRRSRLYLFVFLHHYLRNKGFMSLTRNYVWVWLLSWLSGVRLSQMLRFIFSLDEDF